MAPGPSLSPFSSNLPGIVAREICERTGGQIHGLEVVLTGNRIAVTGRTNSYYLKQLAVQAVRNAVSENALVIDVDVDVMPAN